MAISKSDLYQATLKREQAFIVFLAAGETDLSLLPEPLTKAEQLLFELCKEKAEVKEPVEEVKPVEEPKAETKKALAKRSKK